MALSELLLLEECGIPIAVVLGVATWNGALALGVEGSVGAVEKGRRAV